MLRWLLMLMFWRTFVHRAIESDFQKQEFLPQKKRPHLKKTGRRVFATTFMQAEEVVLVNTTQRRSKHNSIICDDQQRYAKTLFAAFN